MKRYKKVFYLYVVCAVVWGIYLILEIAGKTYQESMFSFVLKLLYEVFLIAASVLQYRRYQKSKEE